VFYADHAATTPCLPAATAAVAKALGDNLGNPGSRQHEPGRRALALLDDARAAVAGLINARPAEVILTSGATEALNLGILGVAARLISTRPRFVTWAAEHSAVLEPYQALARAGAEVAVLGVDRQGRYAPCQNDNGTALVSVMLVNNETGVIQNVAAISAAAHAAGALVCCDATAAIGRMPVDVTTLGADLVAFSGHKFYAPPGTGALWIRRGLAIDPLIHGGGQERGLRSGTPNIPGLAGLAVAARAAQPELTERIAHLTAMTARLEQRLITELPGIVIHGRAGSAELQLGLSHAELELGAPGNSHPPGGRAPGTTMVSLPGLCRGWLAQLVNVAASGGSACSAGSHVLAAMGVPDAESTNALRLSLGIGTSVSDVEAIADEVIHAAQRLAGLNR